jgi:hypothetical protein
MTGCVSPKFTVKENDSRFSDNKNKVYVSENNRISKKSVAGGIHIDDKGVYMNPFVEKNKDTGKVVSLGFYIFNRTDYDTTYGDVNQLGEIESIIFHSPDEGSINLKVINQATSSSSSINYNPAGNYASYGKIEAAFVKISESDFHRIALSNNFSCKVTGSKRSVVFEDEDISPDFKSNLKLFWKEYVK